MEGVSEANIVSMAAGLALEGKVVYINTIATFLTRRCFEQVVLDLGLHNTNVRLIASGGGLVYAPLGPTHLATEDIAILRAIPNMTIICPADAEEMKRIMPDTLDHKGPVYIRLGKGGDPVLTTSFMEKEKFRFKIGKAFPFIKGKDALIVTTGVTLGSALEASDHLSREKISCGVLHVPTVKPFDIETFISQAEKVKAVVSVEEHTVIGGLGSTLAEIIAESRELRSLRLKRVGLPDQFPNDYGSQADLLAKYLITKETTTDSIRELLG